MTGSILDAIGGTPLVELRSVVPAGCARIVVKLESHNPTGSMKDRMAVAAIGAAERDGKLKTGYTVVEYTGGSTGTSLALVCAAKRYAMDVVSSPAFSKEKLDHMRAYGACLTLVPYDGKGITKQVFLDMIECASKLAAKPKTYWTDQLHNADMAPGYAPIADEAWEQTGGRIDAFVHMVGTSHSLRGVGERLKSYNAEAMVAAVEPAESPVLSGGSSGAHDIEGVGIGYTPPMYDSALVDRVIRVSTADAKAMARRLAREEGLFGGTSSGANVCASIELGSELGPGASVLTLQCDSGLKYLSTDLYRD